MTTAVQILCPSPNHKRVRVQAFYVSADGNLSDVPATTVDLNHGETTDRFDFHLHGSMMLKVSEID